MHLFQRCPIRWILRQKTFIGVWRQRTIKTRSGHFYRRELQNLKVFNKCWLLAQSMSRKLAWISENAIDAITYFSSARQKNKTLSRLLQNLSERSYGVVKCKKGRLLLNKLRSPHAASAAEHFFVDEPETLNWIDGFDDGRQMGQKCYLGVHAGVIYFYTFRRA